MEKFAPIPNNDTVRYFIIRDSKGKLAEYYDMKGKLHGERYMHRYLLKKMLKSGQTFSESNRCPVRQKKTNILAEAVNITAPVTEKVRQRHTIGY